jgi:hypothetical protein
MAEDKDGEARDLPRHRVYQRPERGRRPYLGEQAGKELVYMGKVGTG